MIVVQIIDFISCCAKKLEAAKFGVSEVPLCELVSMAFVPALILRNYKIRGKS